MTGSQLQQIPQIQPRQKGQQGMALAVVLMVMALLTAMVVEFAYSVQTKTDMLNNWHSLQRLSLAANSGASVAAKIISYLRDNDNNVSVELPPYKFFDLPLTVSLSIQDEYARFNVNKLVQQKGTLNKDRYEAFLRMLEHLELEAEVADRIADWIDPDEFARAGDSELNSRNSMLSNIEEVSQIPGIDPDTYAKLKPYITVHGDGEINVNLASVPVLVTIADGVGKDMAELIIESRQKERFGNVSDLNSRVPGIAGLKKQVDIIYMGNMFRVVSTARDTDGLKRIVECVIKIGGKKSSLNKKSAGSSGGNTGVVVYWRES